MKHGEMEREVRERVRAVKGRNVIGSLARIMRGGECVHGGRKRLKE